MLKRYIKSAEKRRKQEEEISANLQRLAPAVVHMSKKQRDKFQQRILEAPSQEDIIQALNHIDPRPTKQQRQGHAHIQHQPSGQSANPSRTPCVTSQSALPHDPTEPPEPEHKHAGGPEKGNWSHRSGQGGQQGQQEQYDQKQNQGQHDLPHQGQHYKQLNQSQSDHWRNQGQKEQLNQRQQYQLDQGQRDELNQGKQEQEQEVERDQQLRQGQYKSGRDTPGQKYQQEKQEQQDLHDQGKQYQQQGQGSQKQKEGQRDQQSKQCQQEKAQHQGQQGLKDLKRQGQQDQQLNQSQKDQLNHGQHEQQQQQAKRNQQLRQGHNQKSKRGQEDQNRQQGYVPVSHDANCKGYNIFGFFISMFLLLPLASAQCSTCLGGRCYDTGQCILGCVPGYMNRYCNEACPSKCLNNVCLVNTTSATITCTDGCKAGYCGTKCTRPCPDGCVTCDRRCGSCNKTLCPERRYGEGCRSVCSPNYEKCDRETGKCLRCRRGYFGDNCDQKCQTCYPRGWNLIYKCYSGCEVCKEQDPCPEGLFGVNCELECPAKCGLSPETAGHPCNRATGECSAGCISGYHGRTCNYTCGLCVGRICNQDDGVCTSGCVSGYTQKSQACEKLPDTGDGEVTVSEVTLISCLFISSLVIIVLGLVCALALSRRGRKPGYCEDDDKEVSQRLR